MNIPKISAALEWRDRIWNIWNISFWLAIKSKFHFRIFQLCSHYIDILVSLSLFIYWIIITNNFHICMKTWTHEHWAPLNLITVRKAQECCVSIYTFGIPIFWFIIVFIYWITSWSRTNWIWNDLDKLLRCSFMIFAMRYRKILQMSQFIHYCSLLLLLLLIRTSYIYVCIYVVRGRLPRLFKLNTKRTYQFHNTVLLW